MVAHCLAAPGRDYVVHLHAGVLRSAASRTLTLTLAGITRGVRGAWTDTTSGAATALVGAARVADGANTFVAPHGPADSYVLRLEVL